MKNKSVCSVLISLMNRESVWDRGSKKISKRRGCLGKGRERKCDKGTYCVCVAYYKLSRMKKEKKKGKRSEGNICCWLQTAHNANCTLFTPLIWSDLIWSMIITPRFRSFFKLGSISVTGILWFLSILLIYTKLKKNMGSFILERTILNPPNIFRKDSLYFFIFWKINK